MFNTYTSINCFRKVAYSYYVTYNAWPLQYNIILQYFTVELQLLCMNIGGDLGGVDERSVIY